MRALLVLAIVGLAGGAAAQEPLPPRLVAVVPLAPRPGFVHMDIENEGARIVVVSCVVSSAAEPCPTGSAPRPLSRAERATIQRMWRDSQGPAGCSIGSSANAPRYRITDGDGADLFEGPLIDDRGIYARTHDPCWAGNALAHWVIRVGQRA